MYRPNSRRTSRRLALVALIAGGLIAACGAAAAATDNNTQRQTILMLPFDMVDTSLQGEINHGPLDADVARLKRTQQTVRHQVENLDAFHVIDPPKRLLPAIKQARKRYRYLHRCNGCQLEIGREAGADLVMTGWVQKVSNLILNFNISLQDVNTGNHVAGGSVDMRGNTDKAWRRAAIYFVKHNLIDTYRARRTQAGHNPDDGANAQAQ